MPKLSFSSLQKWWDTQFFGYGKAQVGIAIE